jgi:hypothetical protein
MKPTQ